MRVTLGEPVPRTLIILDADGRPVAGVRVATVLHASGLNRQTRGRALFTPDDSVDRMTTVTGTQGVATIAYLAAAIDPLTVRVTAPGIVPHTLALPYRPGSREFSLTLGGRRRLAARSSSTRASRP